MSDHRTVDSEFERQAQNMTTRAQIEPPDGFKSGWPSSSQMLECKILNAFKQLEEQEVAPIDTSRLFATLNKWSSAPVERNSYEQALENLVHAGRLKLNANHELVGCNSFLGRDRNQLNTKSEQTGRDSASSVSARSKSTTLDSGIQASSWRESPTSASTLSDEQPPIPLVIVEPSAHSTSAVLSRLAANRPRDRARDRARQIDEQVEAVTEEEVGRLHVKGGGAAQMIKQDTANQPQKRRGFSLNRSFSFHRSEHQVERRNISGNLMTGAKQQCELDLPNQLMTNERNDSTSDKLRGKTETLARLTRATSSAPNSASLFRSKSLRVVSGAQRAIATTIYREGQQTNESNCDKVDHQECCQAERLYYFGGRLEDRTNSGQRQATIDYLASAQHRYKRTFSMRRNSLLAFGKEELGGGAGRIAMFLRNLFSLRRTRSRLEQKRHNCQPQGGESGEPRQHHGRLAAMDEFLNVRNNDLRTNSRLNNGSHDSRNNNNDDDGANLTTNNRLNSFVDLSHGHYADRLTQQLDRNQRRSRRRQVQLAAASPASDGATSSSPSNSLIEILDCSPSLGDSRRRLRQEETRASSASRATWHLIKRSESSLSQHSNVSAATNKSTVSQQLRRHLDKAHEGHRNQRATSKRERDFIDSINVLRQASRHASLENSRASSKNRQAIFRPVGETKANSVSTSAATSDDSSNSSVGDHSPEWPAQTGVHCYQNQANDSHALHGTDLSSIGQRNNDWLLEEQQLSPTMKSATCQELQLPTDPCCCLYTAPLSAACLDEQMSANPHQHFQAGKNLCQLAFCPMVQHANSHLATPLACCPLSSVHSSTAKQQPIALNNSNHHHHPQQQQQQLNLMTDTSDLSCPIWRSIIYSYCQQSAPFNVIAPSQIQLPVSAQIASQPQTVTQMPNIIDHLQQAPAQAFIKMPSGELHQAQHQLDRSHTFSSTSLTNLQQQQHNQQQHNTTIDLKIEIGADFKKQLLTRASSQRQSQMRTKERQQSSSSAITSDSLDSSSHDEEPSSDASFLESLTTSQSSRSAPSESALKVTGSN